MSGSGNTLLRLHGAALMLITSCFTLGVYTGIFLEIGPYSALSGMPMVAGGLAQAYPLMGLIGLCLWTGARSDRPRFFSLVGIAAHCALLVAYMAFWSSMMESPLRGAVPLGLSIHGFGIGLELVALWCGFRSARRAETRRPLCALFDKAGRRE